MLKHSKDTPSYMFLHSTRWNKKKILMKSTQMHQKLKSILMNAIILMKSLFENKLHQNPSKSIFFLFFFFFSVLMEILIQLKCVKIFIKIISLIDFDEIFDAFALALRFTDAVVTLKELIFARSKKLHFARI